jgi:hypothetical protein
MPPDRKRDATQDATVAATFPASDPPSGTGEQGTRAVPPQEMMRHDHPPLRDAVVLRRRFPDTESAKLALEGLVRDGPLDRDCAELQHEGAEVELRASVPPQDAARLRVLLARA